MRWLRALGALLVLLAGVVGVPFALVALGGDPSPSGSVRGLLGRLLRPDDGSLLVGLVTVVAWLAWVVFALSVLVELGNLMGTRARRPVRFRLPGLAGPQQLAGVLLAAVVAAVLVPAVSRAAHPAVPPPPAPTPTSTSAETARPSPTPPVGADGATRPADPPAAPFAAAPHGSRADRVPKGHLHVVERGDDLWTLAERFYGQGREWRRIAAANPDLLSGGPDRLQVGTRLAIPGVEATPSSAGERVVVEAGDTLASIAERAYGDAGAWPTVFTANRHLIADPDQIDAGLVLSIPEPSMSTRPSARTDSGPTDSGRTDSGRTEDVPAPDGTDRGRDTRARPTAPPSRRPAPTPTQAAPTQVAPTQVAPTQVAPTQVAPTQVAPTQVAPTQVAPTQVAPTQVAPTQAVPAGERPSTTSAAEVLAPAVAGIGGLLAAGLIGGLLVRRRLQLAARPVGRRILHPSAPTQTLETALGQRQQPMSVASLDLVLRAVALHCHRSGRTLPELLAARVSTAEVELILRTPDGRPPVGFIAQGRRWVVAAGDADYLAALEGVETAPRAYPTLVTVGIDEADRQVLVELEQAGLFGYDQLAAAEAEGLVLAMATELAFAPWADELFVTVIGTDGALPAAADRHNLTHADDVDALLDRLERRAEVQRRHLTDGTARQKRVDPELCDPWAPEVVLVASALSEPQTTRLRSLVTREPRVTAAVVMPVPRDDLTAGLLGRADVGRADVGRADVGRADAPQAEAGRTDPSTGERRRAVAVELRPLGWGLDLQRLDPTTRDQVVELLAVTGTDATTPAPWWHHDLQSQPRVESLSHFPLEPGAPVESLVPPEPFVAPEPFVPLEPGVPVEPAPVEPVGRRESVDGPAVQQPGSTGPDAPTLPPNVTVLAPVPRRAWANEEDAAVARLSAAPTGPVHHPTVLLLGPLDLVGVAGVEPARASRQCLEYCAWLLEHPGSTAPAMASALAVAEGTRRSNVSRLRSWLGESGAGEPYLPDAYSGRIFLDPAVSSDWQRLQILTAPGINQTSTESLLAALELVRGAPLADAAPGQWHWAEELRTDMASAVRDLGIELTERALADHDLDLARWAASRALVAAPEDEQLLCVRIRTEHQAGRTAEVERLALRVAAQARTLAIDLDPGTVILLQQVLEGRVRARLG